MQNGMKKLIMIIMVVALTISLTACGDEAKDLSDKKYQNLLNSMGIEGIESVLDNVVVQDTLYDKIPSKDYRDAEHNYSVWKTASELCGEQKDYFYYGCYGLGEDQEQAEAMREEYKGYLLEQGYEYKESNAGFGDIYVKDSYVVMV